MPSTTQVVVLFLAVALLPAIFSVAQALAGRVLGARPLEVAIGWGPRLLEWSVVGDVRVQLRLLPGSSFVKFATEGHVGEEGSGIDRLQVLLQVAVILAGPAAGLAFSGVCLGAEAVRQLVRGFWQLLQGAVFPLSVGASLARQLFSLSGDRPIVALGIVAAKWTAMTLLPLPPLAGQEALIRLLTRGHPSRLRRWWVAAFGWAGVLLCLSWLVAIAAAVVQADR